MDAGYIFAPYIPITVSPVMLDSESFKPRKGIMKRYGKKLLQQGAAYYGKMTIGERQSEEWIVKKKPKVVWRSITDDWEPNILC